MGGKNTTFMIWGHTPCFRLMSFTELSFFNVNKQTLAYESTPSGKILHSSVVLFIQRAGFWNPKLFGEQQRSQLCFGSIRYSGKIKFYQPSKVNCH